MREADPDGTATAPAAGLPGVLDALAHLVSDRDRVVVAELQRRLAEDRLRILVAGEAKRGKSTLINALLGRDLLPAGVLPLTAIATTLVYGDAEDAEVRYADGRVEHHPAATLADFVTETGNPDNAQGVAEVVLSVPHPLLGKGIELVDTPGVGSVHDHNTAHARQSLARMDAALFVTSADPPVSATERALLADIRELAIRVIVVLSKADRIEDAELREVREFVTGVVGAVLEEPVAPHVLSARAFLHATTEQQRVDSGVPALRSALVDYLAARRRSDLTASVAGHARRLAQRAADEARLTLRTAQLSEQARSERGRVFADRLAAIQRLADESAALGAAGVHGLITASNAAAAQAASQATGRVLAGVETWVAAHDDLPTPELDREGREWLRDAIAAEARRWRSERERELDTDIAELLARLQSRLDEQVAAVRAAAAEAFDLRFDGRPVASSVLDAPSRFSAYGSDLAGLSELFAATVRTHLPGAVGRRRVGAHLRQEAGELTDRAFGRARSDIQQRLQDTGRRLRADVAGRHGDAVARIQEAIRAGRQLAEQDAADGDRARAEVGLRIERLVELATACTRIAATVTG